MAVKTIKTSGGDFTSISGWISSLPATLTAEERGVLYIAGLSEAFGVGFSGFTTTSTNKIVFDGSGLAGTGVARSGSYVTGTLGVIRFGCDFVDVIQMDIESTDGSGALQAQALTGTNSNLIDRCILRSSGSPLAASNGSTNYTIKNSLIYSTGAARTYDARGAGTLHLYDSIIYTQAGDFPFLSDPGHTVKGVYVGGASNQCFWSSGSNTGSNNAASDTTATAQYTSSINSIAGSTAFTSVTSGSEDFRTKTGFTTFTDAGIAITGVTVDIIGTTRPQGSTPDIGAFENIVAGAVANGQFLQFM